MTRMAVGGSSVGQRGIIRNSINEFGNTMASIFSMRGLAVISTALVATLAAAQSSTFRIAQVFSDITGSIQFIELVESAGLDGQHRLAGLTLTSTHNGIVK